MSNNGAESNPIRSQGVPDGTWFGGRSDPGHEHSRHNRYIVDRTRTSGSYSEYVEQCRCNAERRSTVLGTKYKSYLEKPEVKPLLLVWKGGNPRHRHEVHSKYDYAAGGMFGTSNSYFVEKCACGAERTVGI